MIPLIEQLYVITYSFGPIKIIKAYWKNVQITFYPWRALLVCDLYQKTLARQHFFNAFKQQRVKESVVLIAADQHHSRGVSGL